MIAATQGHPIAGMTILQKIEDPMRLCTIYLDTSGDLVIGLGGTRPHWLDWLANLDPTIEAKSLMWAIGHWVGIYQPSKVTLIGHSQGGAHALTIAKWVTEAKCEVVTYGGLPTRDAPGCPVTNYLRRDDPMAWVPWWVFGLRRFGQVVKVGPRVWFPSALGHDPKMYEGVE